jgi:hypothetical protein
MRPPVLASERLQDRHLRRAVVLSTLLIAFWVVNPAQPLPVELCVLKRMTGWSCPTCGLTRAVCFALRGEWVISLHWHPAGPLAAATLVAWTARSLGAAAGHVTRRLRLRNSLSC